MLLGQSCGNIEPPSLAQLEQHFGPRCSGVLNDSWALAWEGWTDLVTEVVAFTELDDDVYFELASEAVRVKLRVFVRLVYQNSRLPEQTDQARLCELGRCFERRYGQVWGENNCCADSLLQLLIAHGVLDESIGGAERKLACQENRRAST